jgi:FkbM family methyltransferase
MVRLCSSGGQNKYRVDTFSVKEPETLDWIDRIPAGSVLWDIGANVGLYTCYAAVKGARVIAFEPSPFNIEFLARNLFLNQLADRVTVVPLPLSDKLATSVLHMSNTDWGGSMSTFGQTYGHDGKPLQEVFRYGTIGLTMMDAIALGLPAPNFIKMDVDGIEHLILAGGETVLHNINGILVEIDDTFAEQAESCATLLRNAGLKLVDKRRWDRTTGTAQERVFNQIWTRDHDTK